MHYAKLPETVDDLETIVQGQSRYVPRSQAAPRVVAHQVGGGKAIPGAPVTASLAPAGGERPVQLFQGTTDEGGAGRRAIRRSTRSSESVDHKGSRQNTLTKALERFLEFNGLGTQRGNLTLAGLP